MMLLDFRKEGVRLGRTALLGETVATVGEFKIVANGEKQHKKPSN